MATGFPEHLSSGSVWSQSSAEPDLVLCGGLKGALEAGTSLLFKIGLWAPKERGSTSEHAQKLTEPGSGGRLGGSCGNPPQYSSLSCYLGVSQ